MEVIPISSGSKGNACLVSDAETTILLDCGIPFRRIEEASGYNISEISGCLITHEHQDHLYRAAALRLALFGVGVYASAGTITAGELYDPNVHVIESMKYFTVGKSFAVLPFDVIHDAKEPLGFLLESKRTCEKLLYVTDTSLLKYSFKGLTHVMIEANFEPEIMEKNVESGEVSLAVAKRTVNNHMSINATIKYLERMDKSHLQKVWLMHLSDANSDEEGFARRAIEATGVPVEVC